MKLRKILLCAGPASLFLLLFASPAVAQFEINPDHPDTEPSPAVKKPVEVGRKQSTSKKSLSQTGAKTQAAQTTAGAKPSPKKRVSAGKTAAKKRTLAQVARKSNANVPGGNYKGKAPTSEHPNGEAATVARE